MKVALLLAGHAKEFTNCYPNLKEYILDILKPNIYIHSYEDENKKEIIETYKPVSHFFECENSIPKENFNYKTFSYMPNPMNIYYMWRKRNLCFSLIEDDYDAVIHTRFDCKYTKPIPIENFNLNHFNIPSGGDFENGIFDMFCVSSKNNMKYYFSLYNFIKNYLKEELLHSERLLKKHLSLSNTKINRFDYPIILRKFNSQENCVVDRIFTV